MQQVMLRRGRAEVDEVPIPAVEPGTVLVRVAHSCISVGTELAGIRASGTPLWKRALKQPAKALGVVQSALVNGIGATAQKIRGRLDAGHAVGYSVAGHVVDVGEGITDLAIGRAIACAGAQFAHHAEYVRVPRNLVVALPDGLGTKAGCTVTLGAIALQGVRRAETTLGETFVVAGLGLLGQLVCQILKASGCHVVGIDLDPRRVEQAESAGVDVAINGAGREADVDRVRKLTDGIGADGVIITASTPSDEVVSTAFRMCRKKGRVVLVGDVGLNLDRADVYEKELDFLVSTSYGPGRYDRRYEEEGCDYPISYVRWTENRNMSAFARLLATKQVNAEPFIEAEYPVTEAAEAYERLNSSSDRPLIVVLAYPQSETTETADVVRVATPSAASAQRTSPRLRLGVIGAGAFARSVHLPNVRAMADEIELCGVSTARGHTGVAVAKEFSAGYATTNVDRILEDDGIDAVLIATRHDTHADLALRALNRGKHVLLEKPLALTADELASIATFYEQWDESNGRPPVLTTGFNRRFSPHVSWIAERIAERTNPLVVTYRMNAGYIPPDHWVHGAQGGGRNIGEACHVYDLFLHLTGSEPVDVQTSAMRPATGYYTPTDNFTTTITFADGSIATLTYVATGHGSHPKERMEVFVDGHVYALDNYTTTVESGGRGDTLKTRGIEKGHREELERFIAAARGTEPWPIPLQQQIDATNISFEVEKRITRPTLGGALRPLPDITRVAG